MLKTFIGPRLRRLRLEQGQTQADMGRALGISTSYVNLLEKNERSVSVPVLLKLFEVYGVDWRDIAEDDDTSVLADLRAVLQDTLFDGDRPDLPQLRAAQIHSPDLVSAFLKLHGAWLAASDQLMTMAAGGDANGALLTTSPEAAVHNYFRRHHNHFEALEGAAERFWDGRNVAPDDVYAEVKTLLRDRLGLRVRLVRIDEMPDTLRQYDEDRREVLLSEALDHPNRVFQLVHVAGLIENRALFDGLLAQSNIPDAHGLARCRVELANYFAAAVLMPYGPYLAEALATKYDFDHLATRFGVSFEQACHRATTLQRSGAQGVPFFFLRIDKAGNVTKRFNATDFHLAEYGGACPRLDVHTSFRTPGRIVPQFVEMPDTSQFFVFARTVDRPSVTRHAQDVRLAVAMGCAVEHVGQIGYAEDLRAGQSHPVPIGINCRICPRVNCDQRAHNAMVLTEPLDERRRGTTRYAS
ncbi:short-chain fatty acyl-CoA regulator family protein [Roseibacterium sp. SDUM158016]|jgi:predicted transcriptional regulator/DNA-binding XRE family transcriptional regulator|uniref:helix-turn-helix domain-containing protein n=1 Tax=Roseicyclus sediminis TaxID=2980997 RepID=UPI0021D146A2|nr:XRE family transcriptional regulator [Roseibacterium sp. SDUM158016]MCU4652808.1 short-chain fatty acyl-CoA regulator family protein [Roseibacterium sp. SDUM158016]